MEEPLTKPLPLDEVKILHMEVASPNVETTTSTKSIASDACRPTKIVEKTYLETTGTSNSEQNSDTVCYHFIKLMQLFPNVHPATLHTVMAMSQNNFFVAIDRLLYARRRQQVQQQQQLGLNLVQNDCKGIGKAKRYNPYPCATSCLPEHSSIGVMQSPRPQLYKVEPKKSLNTRSKTRRQKVQVGNQRLQFEMDENAPLPVQCSVPLRSISPEVSADFSSPGKENLEFEIERN